MVDKERIFHCEVFARGKKRDFPQLVQKNQSFLTPSKHNTQGLTITGEQTGRGIAAGWGIKVDFTGSDFGTGIVANRINA